MAKSKPSGDNLKEKLRPTVMRSMLVGKIRKGENTGKLSQICATENNAQSNELQLPP